MENTELDRIRHSAAHILAMAALRLFPDTKIGVGPVTDEGYYYDFAFPRKITLEDLVHLEAEMHNIIAENLPFQQIVVSKEEGFDILLKRGQIFKAEILRDVPEAEVSFYRTGEEFIDLCRGPHIESTGQVGVVKLINLTDTYWQGDPTRPELQRIAGVAFASNDELQNYLQRRQAIAQRDFRVLAKNLHLTLGGDRGVIFTPGGTRALQQVQKLVLSSFQKENYEQVLSAPIRAIEETQLGLDDYYKYKNRSYKELPIRIYSDIRSELAEAIDIAGKEYASVNTLTFKSYFSNPDRNGELYDTLQAVTATFEALRVKFNVEIFVPGLDNEFLPQITEILQRKGIPQTQIVNPGSTSIKINFQVKDSLGRSWEFARCEYQESNMRYVSKVGEMDTTHTLSVEWVLDSLMAYFIEDEEGLLPIWLAPIQFKIIPISENNYHFAEEVEKLLAQEGFSVEVDARSETMQARIRHAELLKIPVIAVIGDKEQENKSVSLRVRGEKELGMVSIDSLVSTILELYS